jgi:hypothetical protein
MFRRVRFKVVSVLSFVIFYFSPLTSAYAAHPLITDDTGTQGKGKWQLEVNTEFTHESENGSEEDTYEIATALSYGLSDTIDIVLGVPYQHINNREDGHSASEDGLTDISLELKWRFYEKAGLSFALKPGITLPTGDEDGGLGSGRPAPSLFLIGTKEAGPWEFHANLGYIRNENIIGERDNLWHASLAAGFKASERLKVVGNVGIEQNTDRTVNTNPSFLIGGLIYEVSEDVDIDFGIKAGLSRPEADYGILAGIAWRF